MATNVAALNTVYNHYITSYAPKGSSPFDSHKKSELRGVYNSIVKLNKEAPLYLVEKNKDISEFAVHVKENARGLRNTIASLGGLDADGLLGKKVAYSTNENVASAKFIGDSSELSEVPSFDLEVLELASPQVNTGNFLSSSSREFPQGNYSFDIGINGLNYEFQFNIYEEDTNKEIQERLSRLVSNANIGITASVVEDATTGKSALRFQSDSTGLPKDNTSIFTVSDDNTSKTPGSVSYFGLSDISRPATDASFLLNGELRSASSNTFSVEKMYEVTLNGIRSAEGDSTTIALKTDYESLTDNIEHLIGGYNDFLKSVDEYSQKFPKTKRLLGEMNAMLLSQKNEFESFGLKPQEDGSVSVDTNLLRQTILEGDSKEVLSSVKDFTHSLLKKTQQVSLNPMEYVNKTIVAYKNPTKLFASPYITSAYSGMMFNSYC